LLNKATHTIQSKLTSHYSRASKTKVGSSPAQSEAQYTPKGESPMTVENPDVKPNQQVPSSQLRRASDAFSNFNVKSGTPVGENTSAQSPADMDRDSPEGQVETRKASSLVFCIKSDHLNRHTARGI
jgi:hypothetical protein